VEKEEEEEEEGREEEVEEGPLPAPCEGREGG